jgi:hypothetical protein
VLFIINKNKTSLIENPKRGGIPANDKMVTKNSKLNGKITPNFFKSLNVLI